MIDKFSLGKLNPSPAAINFTKFDHFNGLHIRSLSIEDLAHRIKPFFEEKGYPADDETLLKIAPIIQERIQGLDDAPTLAGFFFEETIDPNPDELVVKGLDAAASLELARKITAILSGVTDMKPETAEPPMREFVESSGLKAGQVFGLVRIAVTGQKVSPPLFESMEIIGKEKVIRRMQQAIRLLEAMVERA